MDYVCVLGGMYVHVYVGMCVHAYICRCVPTFFVCLVNTSYCTEYISMKPGSLMYSTHLNPLPSSVYPLR